MALDKVKGSSVRIEKRAIEPAKVAAAKPAAAAPVGKAAEKGSGFEALRKKPMSVTGKYRAPTTQQAVPAELVKSIAGALKYAQAGLMVGTMPLVGAMIADGQANKTIAHGKSNGFGHKSAHGAISKEEWADPTRLMAKLTQYPHGRQTKQSDSTCGPSNMLGAALLSGGPDAAAKVLARVAAAPTKLTEVEQTELKAIAGKVSGKTASFEDLNKAQELMYRAGNTEADAGATVEMAIETGKLNKREQTQLKKLMLEYVNEENPMRKDATELNKLLTKAFETPTDFAQGPTSHSMDVTDARRKKDKSGLTDDELQTLGKTALGAKPEYFDKYASAENVAASLKPGEAITLRIAADAKGTNPNHFVTIGKQPDGRLYIYNPDPGKGDSTLVTGGRTPDAEFLKQLNRYDDRMVAEGDSMPPGLKAKF